MIPDPVKIIRASKALQYKAGKGDICEQAVKNAEAAIENHDGDFTAASKALLDRLSAGIAAARAGHSVDGDIIDAMARPVMDLKANAWMYRYNLVGDLAAIMLDFLEDVKEIDNTVIEIVEAHHKTLSSIITRQIKGDGAEMGAVLQKELRLACARYFARSKE